MSRAPCDYEHFFFFLRIRRIFSAITCARVDKSQPSTAGVCNDRARQAQISQWLILWLWRVIIELVESFLREEKAILADRLAVFSDYAHKVLQGRFKEESQSSMSKGVAKWPRHHWLEGNPLAGKLHCSWLVFECSNQEGDANRVQLRYHVLPLKAKLECPPNFLELSYIKKLDS